MSTVASTQVSDRSHWLPDSPGLGAEPRVQRENAPVSDRIGSENSVGMWQPWASSRVSTQPVVPFFESIELRRQLHDDVMKASRWRSYVVGRLEAVARERTELGVSLECVNHAMSIVDWLLPLDAATPSVTPTPDGGVELFWQRCGWDIIIEISLDESTIWMRDRSSDKTQFGDVGDYRDDLVDVLRFISST